MGIILPPAVMLFFLAYQFQVPFGSMFMATVVPKGILIVFYAVWYMMTAPGDASEPVGAAPETTSEWLWLFTRGLVLPIALIALVLGSIILGWATPSQSGAIGAAGALFLVVISGGLSWALIRDLVQTTANLSAMVFLIIMSAAVFLSVPLFRRGRSHCRRTASLSIGPWDTLLLIVGIVFVLGFFIDWIEITIITLPLFYPVLAEPGFRASRDRTSRQCSG